MSPTSLASFRRTSIVIVLSLFALTGNPRPAVAENPPEVAPAPRVKGMLRLPEGLEMMSLSFDDAPAAGFIAPGSRVDILATLKRGDTAESFPLVDGVMVFAVDAVFVPNAGGKTKYTLSFAVDRDQALLLVLAKNRGCILDVLLRSPDKPATTTKDDYKQRLRFLQEQREVAPAPRGK